MGFISPAPPPFDLEEWKRLPHLERIKPLAQDWALNGFGTPYFVYLLYVVKLVLYAGGGLLVIAATTDGLGGIGDLERLVDGTDRLSEGGCLDDALGGARPRRRLAAADPALLADDRRRPLLAATRHRAAAALARARPAHPRHEPHSLRRGAVRGAGRLARLPAGRRRDRCGRRRRRPSRSACGRRGAGLPRPARLARQGAVPRRPGGGLRNLDDRLPLPARQPRRSRADRLRLHLVGRRGVEAEPPLPLRRHGDDQQHAMEPLAGGEAAAMARSPRGHAALAGRRRRGAPRHRHGVHAARDPARLAGGHDRHDRRRRHGRSSTSTSSRPSRWPCRWSGTSS